MRDANTYRAARRNAFRRGDAAPPRWKNSKKPTVKHVKYYPKPSKSYAGKGINASRISREHQRAF